MIGTAFAETFRLPATLEPQIWFVVDAEATFWMVRFPAIVVPASIENPAAPWMETLPVIVASVAAKLPPSTVTLPVTPPK